MRGNFWLLAGAVMACAVSAADLPLGPLTHDGPPTPEQLSLYLPVTGALDHAALATVRFKPKDGKDWTEAHPLHRIRVANAEGAVPDAFAGVITGLVPGAAYSVEVTIKHSADTVVKTLDAVTRALPPPSGPATKTVAAGTQGAQLQALLDAAQPGDVIQLANGTYAVDKLQIKKGGTEGKPIVLRGESRAGVVLKDPTGIVIQFLEASDVTIENLTIEGSKSDSGTKAASHGIDFWDAPSPQQRVTIRNVTFDGVDMGIIAWKDPRQLLVYDNTLKGNNAWTKESIQTNSTWNDDGIRVPGQGHAVFNNTLIGFGDALAMSSGIQNIGVHFYRNDVQMTGDDAYEGDFGVRNITFYDNRIHNSCTLISFDPVHGGPAFAFRNIAINVGRSPYKLNNKNTGFYLYNNTVVRAEGFGSGEGWGWNQSNNGPLVAWGYRNNILIYRGKGDLLAMESGGQNPIDFTHNAWFPDKSVWWTSSGGSYQKLETARTKLRETRPVAGKSTKRHEGDVICEADPFETDIVLGDSHLKQVTTFYVPKLAEGSAPRGKGIAIPGITDGFTGAAPDMGAIVTGRPVPQWGDRSAASGTPRAQVKQP